MKKKYRIRYRRVDAKYGLPEGTTARLHESGILKENKKGKGK